MMADTPELHPPRVIIRPDGTAPVTVPDDLLEEWRGRVIPTEQEYVRRDIVEAILRAATIAQVEWGSWTRDQLEGTGGFVEAWAEVEENAEAISKAKAIIGPLTTTP